MLPVLVELGHHIVSNDHGELNMVLTLLGSIPFAGPWLKTKFVSWFPSARQDRNEGDSNSKDFS